MTEATPVPRVGVVGGSRSDFPVLETAIAVLIALSTPQWLQEEMTTRPRPCTT